MVRRAKLKSQLRHMTHLAISDPEFLAEHGFILGDRFGVWHPRPVGLGQRKRTKRGNLGITAGALTSSGVSLL